jgi:hypothetical protein
LWNPPFGSTFISCPRFFRVGTAKSGKKLQGFRTAVAPIDIEQDSLGDIDGLDRNGNGPGESMEGGVICHAKRFNLRGGWRMEVLALYVIDYSSS